MSANPSLAKPGNAKKPAPAPKKPKKPMGAAMGIVITAIVMLLLVGGAGAAVYFNLSGVTPQIVAFLSTLGKDNARAAKVLQTRQQALDAAEAKLKEDQATLDTASAALAKAQKDLSAKQSAQASAQANATPAPGASASAAASAGTSVADIYTNMDADTAAGILSKASTPQEIADILKQLDAEHAAAILAAMDAKKAYDVTRLLQQ